MRIELALFIILLCFSCANVVPPSGGKKDLTPPITIKSTPNNYSLFFNSQDIIIEFDEAIQITPSEKATISPYVNKGLNLKSNKNKLIIDIGSTLEDSTTYTIYIDNIIKDLNEGNVLEKLRYSFSTGPSLDSLYIEGEILDAQTQVGVQNVWVGLYASKFTEGDSLFYNQKPQYLTKSSANGSFSFSHLPKKEFEIMAIEDLDHNMLFSLPQERVAFYSNTVIPNCDNIYLQLFDETLIAKDSINDARKDTLSNLYGKLIIDSLPLNSVIVELLLDQTVIFQSSSSQPLHIDSLVPASYTLRVIHDANNNGKWDTGKLIEKRQAEKIEYYSSDIQIRSDWEILIQWNSNAK